ncbi:MAG: ABC transporter ATP-binding protein [Anaerolineaceae bacterium]
MLLQLEDVSKTYKVGTFGTKELLAVNHVSFDVAKGEVVSLIGESGSGKSTIGKMILKLIRSNGGTITYDGKDLSLLQGNEMKDYYSHVQGVFQDPFSSYNPIFKADRLFSIIRDEYYPHVHADEWKAKLDKALKSVGLDPNQVINKYPHQLSGGQLQRFLIARALLLDIQFLVADEIISMLDASTRIDVLNLLAELKKTSNLSILFITHDLSLANYISERAVILYRGCVMEIGLTEKIFNNPQHPYTKMLMASVPRLDKKWKNLETKPQEMQPDIMKGCAYYDRCAEVSNDCAKTRPEFVEVEKDHFVACTRYQ